MNNNLNIIEEPTTCPVCGSDDLGVFCASEHREDEADLVACNACDFQAALTPEGLANLVSGFTPGDEVTVADGVYSGIRGVVRGVRQDEYGISVSVEVTDDPERLLPSIPAGDRQFVHVEPTELCA